MKKSEYIVNEYIDLVTTKRLAIKMPGSKNINFLILDTLSFTYPSLDLRSD
jgi:hypothetical protein